MSNPSPEQQREWGRTLAAGMATWPRLQGLIETAGIAADPIDLIPILANNENARQTAPLAAVFTLVENFMRHQANQADAESLDWQTKVASLQTKVDDLINVLTRSVGSGLGRRISEDPDKFGGTEKDMVKRQQQYVTWRSQIQRCFGMDGQIFNTEFRRIQHVASLLKDDAYDIHREYFETVTDNATDPSRWHWQTYQDVFKTLNDQYATLNLSRQAGIDFDNLWMTNKPFSNFIAEFNKLATKSGKSKSQRVEALKVKVSQELADVITNRSDKPESDDFDGWCRLFQDIYQDLQEKIHLDKLRNNRLGARRAPSTQPLSQHKNLELTINPANTSISSDSGDPMVLDARHGPRPSREQCVRQGLCFYCKQPGHNKDSCAEKKKNDIKFSRPNPPPQVQDSRFNQAGRGITQVQPYMPRPQYPTTRFPRASSQFGFSQHPQFPLSNPYSHLRATEGGFVEGEVASTTSPSPLPSTVTLPSTVMPYTSTSKPENGSPLV